MTQIQKRSEWMGERLIFAIAMLITCGLYFPLVISDRLQLRDDPEILLPLRHISSFSQYVEGIKTGKIFDLNPVRDITIFLDWRIEEKLGRSFFHLTNVMIWICCLALVYRLLRNILGNNFWGQLLFLVFVCHPIFVNSVAWVSARKHILSFFFILLCSNEVCEKESKANSIKISLYYLLSILSQPICLLWPLWWIYRQFIRGDQIKSILYRAVPILILGSCIGWANSWYYSGPYLLATKGISKFISPVVTLDPGFTLLALGRYFFQLVLPIKISTLDYSWGSWANIVGLAMVPGFIVIAMKQLGWRKTVLWLLPFFLPILMVTLRPTWVFVSDNYLLWPASGIFILIGLHFTQMNRLRGRIRYLGILLIPLLLIRAFPLSRAWATPADLVDYAYKMDPTPNVKLGKTEILLKDENFDGALAVAWENLDDNPLGRAMFATVVLHHPQISFSKKEELIRKYPAPCLAYIFRLAAILAQQGKYSEAFKLTIPYHNFLAADPYRLMGWDNHGIMAAEIVFFCGKSGRIDCDGFIEKFRTLLRPSEAEYQDFEKRLASLIR